MLVYTFVGDENLWVRVTHESHEHWVSMNNGDSTVYNSRGRVYKKVDVL